MLSQKKFVVPALIAGTLVGTAALSFAHADHRRVQGAPEAQVSMTGHKGAYVEGDAFTQAPTVAPAPQGTVHRVHLDIVHKLIEIEPGKKFEAWTFGGSVPGPILHVRQGDRIVFSMTNRSREGSPVLTPMPNWSDMPAGTSGPMPHSIDFHGAQINPMDKYRTIDPGQTISFEWTANYPGFFLYHCATPMILEHVCRGMYGGVIVDPADGYPDKVDREYVVVQSEFYTKPIDASHPDLLTADMEAAQKKQPTYVVFNGSVGSMVDHPLKAKAGERVRLFVLNVGPCDTSSFHVVGTLFDKVYLDGNPQNVLHGMQTVLLGSSGAAVVELTIPEAGRYPFVDHEFAAATKGATGYIDATDGKGGAS